MIEQMMAIHEALEAAEGEYAADWYTLHTHQRITKARAMVAGIVAGLNAKNLGQIPDNGKWSRLDSPECVERVAEVIRKSLFSRFGQTKIDPDAAARSVIAAIKSVAGGAA